jgi:protein-disulfide isomerase
MPSRPSFQRTVIAALLVAGAAVATVLAARAERKPYVPSAPAYRQKGPAQAKITVVEFSDFQCPACRFAVEPLKKLEALYGNDMRVIFKHFPLTRMHPKAEGAAAAAECAGQQSRFWEFHDALYDGQAEWTKEGGKSFADIAKSLGLNEAAFAACLKDPATAALVSRDKKDGEDHWVVSTPTFFINGKRFAGARQLTDRGIPWIDKILRTSK